MAASQRRIFHWKGEQVSHVRCPNRVIGSKPCNIPCGWEPIYHTYRVTRRCAYSGVGKQDRSELCPGTTTIFASQKHLAPILEREWCHTPLPSSALIKHALAASSPDDKNGLNQRKHVQKSRRQITNILSTCSHKVCSAFCPQDLKLRNGQKTSMVLD